MQKLIEQLLTENHYYSAELDSTLPTYRGEEFGDFIIIAQYDMEELKNFKSDKNQKTVEVMKVHSAISDRYPDAAKDTALIILHELHNLETRNDEILKRIILEVEENKYGVRVYVLSYAKESLATLGQINRDASQTLLHMIQQSNQPIEKMLKEPLLFSAIQLFIKLPFMRIDSLIDAETVQSLNEQILSATSRESAVKELILNRTARDISDMRVQDFLDDIKQIGGLA